MDKGKKNAEKQNETIGRTFWDFFHKRPFLTIIIFIIIFGLIIYGFVDIKVINGGVIISRNSHGIEQITSNENPESINDWVGNWKIGWRYEKYFDNSDLFGLERDLEFKIVDGKLVGEYVSHYKNQEVKTTIYDLKIIDNRIVGKYNGIFTINKQSYESGEIEFLMFSDKKYFIGKYKRTKPNTFSVDGNSRLWYGRK